MNVEIGFASIARVDERVAAAVGLASGAAAAAAGAAPTGGRAADILLSFLVAALVAWASASAPWWALAAASGVAASIALTPIGAGVGFAGLLLALHIGRRNDDLPAARAVAGAVAVNVLFRSELAGFVGLSAVVGIALGSALVFVGVRARPRSVRVRVRQVLGVVGAFVVMALVGAGLSGATARDDVVAGAQAARDGIAALNRGEYERAAAFFDDASTAFDSSTDRLGGPAGRPARLVPVAAQNLRAGTELASTASDALGTAAEALIEIDPSSLTVTGGSIDLESIQRVEAPLQRVEQALDDLRVSTESVRSPWLLGRLDNELDELDAELAAEAPRLRNALDAVALAPGLLGGEGERRYLVLFTSPAEARGLGGFPGNYAVVTLIDGRIEVGEFARRSDLEDVVGVQGASCVMCPDEFLRSYGQFGFSTGPDGGVAERAWSNVTMPAHFPYVAETAQILFPQSGGAAVDGVIVMDPYVVQALMAYTGPIEVPELDTTVRPEEAARFILVEQYLTAFRDGDSNQANAGRIDALDALGSEVISRLLSGALPDPPSLVDDLAPLVAERRLLFWTADSAEQDLLDRLELLGSLPPLDPTDGGFSVSVTNAGGSKIDAFLERSVDVRVEDAGGQRMLIADVSLTNTAPASGLPDFVIGNSVGLPSGWSRLYVSLYGPGSVESMRQDGEPMSTSPGTEAGWSTYSRYVDIAPGQTTRFELRFRLPVADDADASPTLFEQPLVNR